jgi:hypothetical protein
MPQTLPDGRTESPGVLRIYMASMIILAAFYACSATLGVIFRVAGAALKAVGIGGERLGWLSHWHGTRCVVRWCTCMCLCVSSGGAHVPLCVHWTGMWPRTCKSQ